MEQYVVFGLVYLMLIYYITCNDQILYLHSNNMLEDGKSDYDFKKRLVIKLTIIFFVLGAFRNYNTGVDTITYVNRFQVTQLTTSFQDIWNTAKSAIDSEQGYYFLAKLFYGIVPNAQIWLTFLVLVFLIPTAVLIYKYSECPPLSFIYLLAMAYILLHGRVHGRKSQCQYVW